MYLSILILPLLGSLVSGFLGRKLGIKGSQIVTTTCVVLTTTLAIISFIEVSINHIPVSIHLFRWIDSESLMVAWAFNFDSLTVSMLIPVLIVSSLVHIYSIGYMSNDPHNQRFFSYLSLFTFMMIILVTGNNYLLMFVGWEGVGVCSYLLVSFWFTRIAANQSSLAAFLTNRVGDCFLTIGMFALLLTFGNINYSTIFSLSPYISEDIITLIGILLLLGAMAKSSQIGLHVWLPMAMEGPTPVSALIHAATMVTAGVYLLMRSSPLIEYSSTVLLLCLWIGAITTVFSSLIGLFQQDIKKVIAYSTMSQLGMMVIAIGLSSYNLALFHLVNHAFYKALLFLGAGSVIHAVADNQDFRKYGGLKAFLPLTYSVMLLASLSLVAFPFMTGFYSKDFILESAYGNFSFSTTSVYFIATIGAMFTTLYSVKVLYLTFLTNPNGPQSSYKIAHEGDIYMSLPLIILAIFSIFFGYITKDFFIGLGSDGFSDNSIFIHPSHEITLDTEFAVPVFFKLLPLIFTISLSLIYIIFSEFRSNFIVTFKFSRFGYNFYSFFNQRFLIEAFYNKYITDFILKVGGITTKVIDKGFIELVGPHGLEKGLVYLSTKVEKLSTKVVTSYALYIVVALIIYIASSHLIEEYDTLFSLSLLPVITSQKFNVYSYYKFNSNSSYKSFFSTSPILKMDENSEDSDSDSDIASETTTGERIDPTDGFNIDDTRKICESCNTPEEIETYFNQKYESMRAVLNEGSYIHSRANQEANIEYLKSQKEDVYDGYTLIYKDSDLENDVNNDVNNDSNNDVNSDVNNNLDNNENLGLNSDSLDPSEPRVMKTSHDGLYNLISSPEIEQQREALENNRGVSENTVPEGNTEPEENTSIPSNNEEQIIVNTDKRKREESPEKAESNTSKKVELDQNNKDGPNDGPENGNGPDSGIGPISSGGTGEGPDAGINSGSNANSRLSDDGLLIDSKSNIVSSDIYNEFLLNDLLLDDICFDGSDSNFFLNKGYVFSSKESFIEQKIQIVLDIIHELIWLF